MSKRFKLTLLGLLLIPCGLIAVRFNTDFPNLHFVLVLLTHGVYPAIYAHNGLMGRFFYGPLSLVIAGPLGWLTYEHAKWIWNGLQALSYVLFWIFLTRLYPYLMREHVRWGWLLVWIVAINPIHNNFQSNNIQLMLAAILLGAERLTRRASFSWRLLGGVLVSLASGIKIFPAFIAVYYLLFKPRPVKLGVIAGAIVGFLLPFAVFGPHNGWLLTHDFLKAVTTYTTANSMTKMLDILCLPSLLSRTLGWEGNAGAEIIVWGAAAAFFIFAGWRLKDVGEDDRAQTHVWALALAMMVLLNPSSRPHYFVFYVPAFCSLLEIIYQCTGQSTGQNTWQSRWRPAYTSALVAAMLLIAFTAQAMVGKTLNLRLEAWSIPTVGCLVLCFTLWIALRPIRRPA